MPDKDTIILTARTKRRLKRVLIVAGVVTTIIYIHKLQSDISILRDAAELNEDTIGILNGIITNS